MKTRDLSYLDQVNYGKHDCFITPPLPLLRYRIKAQLQTSNGIGFKIQTSCYKTKLLDKINKLNKKKRKENDSLLGQKISGLIDKNRIN